jgi:hypothetical protein
VSDEIELTDEDINAAVQAASDDACEVLERAIARARGMGPGDPSLCDFEHIDDPEEAKRVALAVIGAAGALYESAGFAHEVGHAAGLTCELLKQIGVAHHALGQKLGKEAIERGTASGDAGVVFTVRKGGDA